MKRANVRTLSLVVTTFTYLLIGAAVFDALESHTESLRNKTLKAISNDVIRKYNISSEDYMLMEMAVIEYKPHKAGPQWKFAGSFYFATVVLVMIGYGHSTPTTVAGKAFCMVYAAIGIPLGFIMFQSIGERLNKFTSVVITKFKKICRFPTPEATEVNLMAATGFLSTVIITTGAAMFSHYEGWNYFDSFYYCFITLTTIGFGDYVALQNDKALTTRPGYFILSLFFIIFGLAIVAASLNLLVLRFMTPNAEDAAKRDGKDAAADGEDAYDREEVMSINGQIVATSLNFLTNSEKVEYFEEVASVCSCNCYGLSSHGNTQRKPPTPLVDMQPVNYGTSFLEQGNKRASL